MRIAILYDFLKELGGLERVMVFQANALEGKYSPEMWFIHVSKKNEKEILNALGASSNIPVKQILQGNVEEEKYANSVLFPSKINKGEADVLMTHSFMTTRMAFKRKKKRGTPYIVMIHHPPNLLYGRNLKWANNLPRFLGYMAGLFLGPLMKSWDKAAVRGANLVIVNSSYTARRIEKIYGIKPEIVYPPVSKEFKILEKKDMRKCLAGKNVPERFVLLHGRMIKDKRPDLAVRAFSEFAKKNKDISLAISGTIEEKKKIVLLVKQLGIANKVRFLGRVSSEELVALYNLAECFLMSAPKEDFGLTPVEAMACGSPVVAWADGAGPQETVVENENGLLAKPYNVLEFAKKMDLAVKKKWDERKISNSMKKYSDERIRGDLLKVVEKVARS